MALSREQFNKLREQGLTVDQIIKSDNRFQNEVDRPAKREQLQSEKTERESIFGGFAKGVAKEAGEVAFGLGKLGTKVGRALLPKELEPKEPTFFEKERPEILEAKTTPEKVGKFAAGVAEFAVPATKVARATEGASTLVKLASRIGTAGAVGTVREGEIGKEAGIAAGTEAALPVAGRVLRPVVNITKRLFKGLGAGLSGVGTDVIEAITNNPKTALEISRQIEKEGGDKILEQNARSIVDGVSKIRQTARKAFGEGLEQLQKEDIKPDIFRKSIQPTLEKFGSIVEDGQRTLKNIEFTDPKNITKASNLIDELSTTKLDGKSVRKLFNKIEDAKFKIATTDERLSYNAFINDLSKSVRSSVSKSTDKLDEINKEFSADMQLSEAIERIFGKVKFKNLKEIDKVAKKLESLFSQSGLDPREIDKFLNKIGISPEEFRTTEAVRQISDKTIGVNATGLSPTEFFQSVTSAVLTPEAVKNASIATGLTEQALRPILEKLAPSARGALIKSLIEVSD